MISGKRLIKMNAFVNSNENVIDNVAAQLGWWMLAFWHQAYFAFDLELRLFSSDELFISLGIDLYIRF